MLWIYTLVTEIRINTVKMVCFWELEIFKKIFIKFIVIILLQ